MSDFVRRLLARIFRRHDVWVRLAFEDGGTKLVGPMDRYAAEVFVAARIAPTGAWDHRRVVSARIVPA